MDKERKKKNERRKEIGKLKQEKDDEKNKKREMGNGRKKLRERV